MKKAKQVKKPTGAEIELRRWCIEQATRWPILPYYPSTANAAAYQTYQVPVATNLEADVIGRAKRIYDWVTRS